MEGDSESQYEAVGEAERPYAEVEFGDTMTANAAYGQLPVKGDTGEPGRQGTRI